MPPPPVDLLEQLVALRSTSDRPSTEVVQWALDRSRAAPDESFVQEYANGRKANLLLRRGPRRDDGGGLVLSGHLDVVPADGEGWRSDPWSLTDAGDRWVGRGSCDMKGFVALAVDRFRRLEGASLDAPLALLLTADEEVGSVGAQRWVEAGGGVPALPTEVLIGEPTGLRAVRLHKGHLRLRLVVRGKAAHSGYPHRGRNAIEAALPALVALARLREQLAGETTESSIHFPEVPYVALNVGRIDGGTATNVVPDRCVVDLGLRPLPGVDSGELRSRVEGAIADALPGERWSLELDNDSPALSTPDSCRLYRTLCEEIGQRGDVGVSFASDGGTLARAGHHCVLFGPGSIEVAHRPDEYLPKDELARAAAVVDRLVERFCGARPA